MLFNRWRAASGPITTAELAQHLGSLSRSIKSLKTPKLGLCVSGGADSMVLAHLFSQIQKDGLLGSLSLMAFVVDHKSRIDSTSEATTVFHRLHDLGIRSEILSMEWPDDSSPLTSDNFETQARVKRYRLLAQASLRNGIRHLVTGHHADDQVETLLMRLLRSHKAPFSAFLGMRSPSAIPCCNSIFGARAGAVKLSMTHLAPYAVEDPKVLQEPAEVDRVAAFPQLRINSANGSISLSKQEGIEIHRPLLNFSKHRIMQTCKHTGLEFVNDSSNFDPTVTTRNAIRHLRSEYELPRALSSESILHLRETSKSKLEALQRRAEPLFKAVRILSLDLRSGTMVVRFPLYPEVLCQSDEKAVNYLLGRLLQVVSPNDPDDESILADRRIVNNIYPNFGKTCSESVRSQQQGNPAFTANRVLVQRHDDTTQLSSLVTTWKFSRQPLRKAEVTRLTLRFRMDMGSDWSQWLLWDNRYWLRVRWTPEYLSKLVIRPYLESDASDLRHLWTGEHRDVRILLDETLADAAPARTRYTLPVILDPEGLRVFPTLNLKLPHKTDAAGAKGKPNRLEWEIRYKPINKELKRYGCFDIMPRRENDPLRSLKQYYKAVVGTAKETVAEPSSQPRGMRQQIVGPGSASV